MQERYNFDEFWLYHKYITSADAYKQFWKDNEKGRYKKMKSYKRQLCFFGVLLLLVMLPVYSAHAEEEKKEEETEAVSGIIAPQEDNFLDEPEVISNTINEAPIQEPEFHFDMFNLTWPLQGNVILNYSMDQTVYFATLDQYKYNPAVIIQAEVNSPVNAVAEGIVTSVETNEETGTTITVDMGDGYSARYGQLKEIPKNQGDYVENGEILGYVNEPTKYYSVEGANLYFQLLKDGAPVDPMEYFE